MTSATRRHDPERRDRIIAVTLDLIAAHGVAKATYRTIASAADIPLGSMTYHFASRDELLLAAFAHFADEGASPLSEALEQSDDAVDALVDVVMADDGFRFRVLLAELYVLAYRDERYADLLREWMRRAQTSLAAHPTTAAPPVVDALQEGLCLQRWFMPEAFPESAVRSSFHALVTDPDHAP